MIAVPKPPKRIKTRKPLNRRGKVSRANEAFSQQMLETWFSQAVIKGDIYRRGLNGDILSVLIKTVDDIDAYITREAVGKTTKHFHFHGDGVQVGHIEDKCLRPDLRWSVSNVSPISPAANHKMKYDLKYRKELQERMRVWVSRHT